MQIDKNLKLIISEKGKHFNGKPLSEQNVLGGQQILYKDKLYYTGNRKHNLVELWQDGKLFKTVNLKKCILCFIENNNK